MSASGPPFWRFGCFRGELSSCHQPSPDQEQVAEREQGEDLGAVLGKSPVAGFQMAELAFDDAEGMLDLGPDHRDDAVDAFVQGVQRAV